MEYILASQSIKMKAPIFLVQLSQILSCEERGKLGAVCTGVSGSSEVGSVFPSMFRAKFKLCICHLA